MGAVGGKAGVQPGRAPGGQVPADVGGAQQNDLRLLVLHQGAQRLGIGVGGVNLQQLVLAVIHLVRAVASQGLQALLANALAQNHARQLRPQVVGQLAPLAEQLVGGALHHAPPLFTKNPHALKGVGVLAVKLHGFSRSFPS